MPQDLKIIAISVIFESDTRRWSPLDSGATICKGQSDPSYREDAVLTLQWKANVESIFKVQYVDDGQT